MFPLYKCSSLLCFVRIIIIKLKTEGQRIYRKLQTQIKILPYPGLLYRPTQIHVHFPIGGERATCHGSKHTNSVRKQQLELSTRT